jgi:Protein of unknown function (DUF2721)
MELPPANEVLGAMITPALLISAAGTLVLSTSNRLGRVVDRVRVLAEMAEQLHPPNGTAHEEIEEKRSLISDQLGKLTARIHYLVPAISSLYIAIGLLVAASISVGIVALLRSGTAWLPVALGLCGAVALFYASTLLIREARLAVDSTLHEMKYVRKVVDHKTAFVAEKSPAAGNGP